jgi:hypothetical protein
VAFSQDLDLNTSEESKLNGSSMTQDEVLNFVVNTLQMNSEEFENSENIIQNSDETLNNSDESTNQSDQIITDSEIITQNSDGSLKLSEEESLKLSESLMNTFPQTKEKKISPLGVNFIVGGTCIVIGFAGGVAFTVWAVNKFSK